MNFQLRSVYFSSAAILQGSPVPRGSFFFKNGLGHFFTNIIPHHCTKNLRNRTRRFRQKNPQKKGGKRGKIPLKFFWDFFSKNSLEHFFTNIIPHHYAKDLRNRTRRFRQKNPQVKFGENPQIFKRGIFFKKRALLCFL